MVEVRRAVQAMEDVSNLSIVDHLAGKKLTGKELRASMAIDILPINFLDKKVLLGAFIFFDQGVFRAREILGFSLDQAVGARDKVRTNNKYEELWTQFEVLIQPNYVEIADCRRKGLSNKRIAELLGKSEKGVEKIANVIRFLGEIPVRPSSREKSNASKSFFLKVSRLREEGLGNQEIAKILVVKKSRVDDAAKFLIRAGIIQPLDKGKVLEKRFGREVHKQQLKAFLETIGLDEIVSLRRLHEISGIEVGYDKFLSLYHEIEREQSVPRHKQSRHQLKTKAK